MSSFVLSCVTCVLFLQVLCFQLVKYRAIMRKTGRANEQNGQNLEELQQRTIQWRRKDFLIGGHSLKLHLE